MFSVIALRMRPVFSCERCFAARPESAMAIHSTSCGLHFNTGADGPQTSVPRMCDTAKTGVKTSACRGLSRIWSTGTCWIRRRPPATLPSARCWSRPSLPAGTVQLWCGRASPSTRCWGRLLNGSRPTPPAASSANRCWDCLVSAAKTLPLPNATASPDCAEHAQHLPKVD